MVLVARLLNRLVAEPFWKGPWYETHNEGRLWSASHA